MMDLEKLEKMNVRKTGTTTLGMVCKDAVVVAAERKATMGYLIASKETEKILQLDDHIVMTMAGVAGDAQALAKYLRAEFNLFSLQNQRKILIKSAASLLANILQGSKFYPYYVQVILAGFDESGPRVFDLDPIGSVEEEKKFFSTGSGSPMALGVLEDSYREGISADEGMKLAIRAIRAAVERDIGSGGKGIDIAVINKDGVKITKHDFDKMKQ